MQDKDNIQQFIEIAANIFNVPQNQISVDSSKMTVATWDSLAHLRLFLEVENKFGVSFSSTDIQEISSLREIYEKIERIKKDSVS